MSTPFPILLPPPGSSVLRHPLDSTPPSPSIPPAFTEALSVRIAVFNIEQHCNPSKEIDVDDPRSWHWIIYASVSGPTHALQAQSQSSILSPHLKAANEEKPLPETGEAKSKEAESLARRPSGIKLPIATIRLVPPPHGLHPKPGSVDDEGGAWPESAGPEPPEGEDRPTAMHDGREPYIKLSRVATLKEYRGLGLGRLLMTTAMEWAQRNPEALRGGGMGGMGEEAELVREGEGEGVARERASSGAGLGREWKGLVLVHAQLGVVGLYERLGFVRDEGLGSWVEEGIRHVGMWRRLEVVRGGEEGGRDGEIRLQG